MSQFIIATNNANAIQRNAVTEYVKSKGWAYWHHFEDLWMFTTAQNDVATSQQIFNELTNISEIGKTTYIIVIRLAKPGQPMTHFGFGPAAGWDWTKQYWGSVG
jgi:hypothetical protein